MIIVETIVDATQVRPQIGTDPMPLTRSTLLH